MILVCNAIRNDLQHPNEYIRGATLRFLCKLHEPELLDPLIPSILSCLEHRHAYVRKNAIFAVYSIAIEPATSHHIPEPAETIQTFLDAETDATCIRNAFIALSNLDRERAIEFVRSKASNAAALDELLQLAFIEFIRRDAAHNPDYVPFTLRLFLIFLILLPILQFMKPQMLLLDFLLIAMPSRVLPPNSLSLLLKSPTITLSLLFLNKSTSSTKITQVSSTTLPSTFLLPCLLLTLRFAKRLSRYLFLWLPAGMWMMLLSS